MIENLQLKYFKQQRKRKKRAIGIASEIGEGEGAIRLRNFTLYDWTQLCPKPPYSAILPRMSSCPSAGVKQYIVRLTNALHIDSGSIMHAFILNGISD
jgi:hypothetical protein